MGKRNNGDRNKMKRKSRDIVVATQMWKIDDPLELAVNIIKYVALYGIKQIPVSLILSFLICYIKNTVTYFEGWFFEFCKVVNVFLVPENRRCSINISWLHSK